MKDYIAEFIRDDGITVFTERLIQIKPEDVARTLSVIAETYRLSTGRTVEARLK